MWIVGKLVLSAIVVALIAVSPEVHAQLEPESSLIFGGISEPWQFLLKVGVCVGLFASLTPCARSLLDTASTTIGSPDQSHETGGLNKFILFLSCLVGGLFSYVVVSTAVDAFEVRPVDSSEIWTAVIWGVILTVSALSLFGLYQIRFPESLQVRYQQDRTESIVRGIMILFVIGFVPTLVAVMVLATIFDQVSIADNSTFLFGGVSVLALLWSVVVFKSVSGISPGLSLNFNQFGEWTMQASRLLGVLQIAAVIHLLGVFPEVPVLLLWGMLFMVTAVYLGATQKSSQMSKPSHLLSKGAGIAVMIWGGVSLVGASAGNRDLANPLPQLSTFVSGGSLTGAKDTGTSSVKVFTYVKTANEFEQLLTSARTDGRPVLLDFYADWCLDCKRMDRSTFRDPTVVARLTEDFLALKIDVTDPDYEFGRDTRKRFGVFGPPALVMFDGQGNHVKELLTYGYLNTDEMLQLLSRVPMGTTSES